MKLMRSGLGLLLAVVVALPAAAPAQGRGKGADQKQNPQKPQVQEAKRATPGGPQKAKPGKPDRTPNDQKNARPNRSAEPAFERAGATDHRAGNAAKNKAKFKYDFSAADVRPSLRRFITSSRPPELIVSGALARAHARGVADNDIRIVQVGERVQLRNASGITLLDLDDARARNLGYWTIDPLDDEVRSGAPSFCRSGAGHPVWGRQWCLEKGFGLGGYQDLRWGRTNTPDIRFGRQVDSDRLARSVLIDVLGDVVFNRLALHAITLGFSDPLYGVWLGEPAGPRVLRLTAGDYPIAEIVDTNRDNRADVMVLALRAW